MWLKVCVNGSRARGQHAALPLTPAAMAAEAVAAVRAGAAAVHLHVRDAAGDESLRRDEVAACVSAVRDALPQVPVGVSTGLWITGGDLDRRAADIAAWAGLDARARPDFASVNLGEAGALEVWAQLAALGVGVEAGVWSPPEVALLRRAHRAAPAASLVRVLLEVVDAPAGREAARAAELLSAARAVGILPVPAGGVPVLLHGEDAGAWTVLRLAAGAGLQARIGLEDALAGPRGEPVRGNADLVRLALALAAPAPGRGSGGPTA